MMRTFFFVREHKNELDWAKKAKQNERINSCWTKQFRCFFSFWWIESNKHFAIKTFIRSICGWICKPWFGFPRKLLFSHEIYVYGFRNADGCFIITIATRTLYTNARTSSQMASNDDSQNVHMCDKHKIPISKVNNLPLSVVLHGWFLYYSMAVGNGEFIV